MNFVPFDELKEKNSIPFAPMIDFLFLMLAFFATLAVTRIGIKDTDLELVKTRSELPSSLKNTFDEKVIHISVLETGGYKWVTDLREHKMQSAKQISDELLKQYQKGLLPENKARTRVLLKIDRNAKWEPILKALVAIREAGFEARPIYEPM